MQIIVMIFLLILCVWIIPKKNIKGYLFFTVAILAGLFFFFWPDNRYDLYRYYLMLPHYNKLSFLEVIGFQVNALGDSEIEIVVDAYINNYKIYSVAAWMISKIGLCQVLAVLVCILNYGMMMLQINRIYEKENMKIHTLKICFVFGLMGYNYILLSLVRQSIVYMAFGFVLYYDLVENYNKKKCFIIYLLLCAVHSSAIMLLGFRLLIIVGNKLTMPWIVAGFSSIYALIPWIEQMANHISVPFVAEFLGKIPRYLIGRQMLANQHVSRKATLMYIFLFLLLLYFMKYSEKRCRYKKYTNYLILLFAFCAVMHRQDDIYNRMQLIFHILFIPVVMQLVDEFSGKRRMSVKKKSTECQLYFGVCLLSFGILVLFVYFLGTCNDSYIIAQNNYSFENFMKNGDMTAPLFWWH